MSGHYGISRHADDIIVKNASLSQLIIKPMKVILIVEIVPTPGGELMEIQLILLIDALFISLKRYAARI